jgi:hypothetical protein
VALQALRKERVASEETLRCADSRGMEQSPSSTLVLKGKHDPTRSWICIVAFLFLFLGLGGFIQSPYANVKTLDHPIICLAIFRSFHVMDGDNDDDDDVSSDVEGWLAVIRKDIFLSLNAYSCISIPPFD